jgi:hypothetical protein
MLMSHFLGGYRHSLFSADPAQHKAFQCMQTSDMLARAEASLSTRQLHAVVSEFVAATTLAAPELLWSVGETAAQHASNVACGQLRAFGRSTRPTISMPHSCMMTLCKALNVNTNSSRCKLLTEAESACARQMVGMVSPLHLLRQSGVATSMELDIVDVCTRKNRGVTLKSLRQLLKPLSQRCKGFLSLAMHTSLNRSRLIVNTLSRQVQQAQKNAMKRMDRECGNYCVYCETCCTIRTPVNGLKQLRAKAGASVDMHSDVLYCNKCNDDKCLVEIDLLGRQVIVLGPKLSSHRASNPITMCSRCGQASVCKDKFGIYPVCSACHSSSHADLARPGPCFVCKTPCVGSKATWCEAITDYGSVDIIWYCWQHASLASDRTLPQSMHCRHV